MQRASLEMFGLIRQLHRHASDIAQRLSACLSVCQGFILCMPPPVCACTGSGLTYYVSQRAGARSGATLDRRLELVIVHLHLQEAPCHLAATACGVVRGTQTKVIHCYVCGARASVKFGHQQLWRLKVSFELRTVCGQKSGV